MACFLKLNTEDDLRSAVEESVMAQKLCPKYVKAFFRAAQAREALAKLCMRNAGKEARKALEQKLNSNASSSSSASAAAPSAAEVPVEAIHLFEQALLDLQRVAQLDPANASAGRAIRRVRITLLELRAQFRSPHAALSRVRLHVQPRVHSPSRNALAAKKPFELRA